MEREAEQSCIYLWSFPSRRLPARRLPFEPTRPARSVLGISLSLFFFFLSVLIVYLFLLPVQPLPSAGHSRCPNPWAPGPGKGCLFLPPIAPPPPEPVEEKVNNSGFREGEKRGKKRKEEEDSSTPSRCHKAWGPRRSPPDLPWLEEPTEVSGREGTCHQLFLLLPSLPLCAFRAFLPDEAGAGGDCSSWHWLWGAGSSCGHWWTADIPCANYHGGDWSLSMPRAWMWSRAASGQTPA